MVKAANALVFYADGKTPPGTLPAIEHEGRVWLVPYWFDTPKPGVKKPKHLIPADLFQCQKGGPPGMDYVVNAGLPRQLFAREIPIELQRKYQIVDCPDIEVLTE